MRRNVYPPVLTLVIVVLVALPAIGADAKVEKATDDAAKAKRAQPAERSAQAESPYAAAARAARSRATSKVITTEDLEKMSRGASGFDSFNDEIGVAAGPTEDVTPDYVGAVQREQAARAVSHERAVADVDAARTAVQNLEKQLLAVKNPFAARVDLSDEEKEARADDASTADRIQRLEQELADARVRLAASERVLAGATSAAPAHRGPAPSREE